VLLLATDAYGGHGGIAFYNRCLAEALAQMEEVSEVVVAPRVMRFAAPEVPAKVRFLAGARGTKLHYLAALVPLVFEKFDLVICGHLNLLAAAAPLAKLRGASLVVQVHGIEAWRRARPITRLLLPQADAVWSVSQLTVQRMNRWAKLPLEAYRIIPNTFHAGQFGVEPRNPELVRRYGLEGHKVVMTLARLAGFERYKGIDEILEAMPDLLAAEPSLTYIVVGDGDDQARLEAKAHALRIERHVIFTGFVAEDQKADYLRLADVFALPGRGEGFGIVFLEALACGVPVVGSQIDGSREALLDGELGELANPDSQQSVIDCVLKALGKPHGVPSGLKEFGWPSFQAKVADNARRVIALPRERRLPSETAARP
jgi:glycosyltransferase involved in cell wall biosynthesis